MRRWDNLLTRIDADAHVLNDPRMNMLNDVEKAERDAISVAYIVALLSFPVADTFTTSVPFYTPQGVEMLTKVVRGKKVPSYTEVTITSDECKILKTGEKNLFDEVQLIVEPNVK